MIPKIENRNYGYRGFNVVTVSATLNIYAADGTTLLDSFGIRAEYDITQSDFVAEISRQLNSQISEYMTKLQQLEARRLEVFPTSTDFRDAVDQIFNPIQTAIGG